MQEIEKLEYGYFYHVYNHAVGGRNLFKQTDNYEYFLHLYDKYIAPLADTFAWALMPNHFHFLIRIKLLENIPDRVWNPVRNKDDIIGTPSQQFSKLFNAYAQAYNKRFETNGALFERRFKRKKIDHPAYLKNAVMYIHNNPVHHGFCEHVLEYPWTSYLSCISVKPTKLKREEVIGWFNEKGEFETKHKEKINWKDFEIWLGL